MNLLRLTTISLSLLLISSAAFAFNDVSLEHQHRLAIEFVERNGIVSGHDDGTYRPNEPITRAAFSKIIAGAAYGAEYEEFVGGRCFPDVADQWFSKPVCFLKAKGVIQGYDDGFFYPARYVSFVEGAKMISTAFALHTPSVPVDAEWYETFVLSLTDRQAVPTDIAEFSSNLSRGQMAAIIYRILADVRTEPALSYNQIGGARVSYRGSTETNGGSDGSNEPECPDGTYPHGNVCIVIDDENFTGGELCPEGAIESEGRCIFIDDFGGLSGGGGTTGGGDGERKQCEMPDWAKDIVVFESEEKAILRAAALTVPGGALLQDMQFNLHGCTLENNGIRIRGSTSESLSPAVAVVDGNADVDMFFSLRDETDWYIQLSTGAHAGLELFDTALELRGVDAFLRVSGKEGVDVHGEAKLKVKRIKIDCTINSKGPHCSGEVRVTAPLALLNGVVTTVTDGAICGYEYVEDAVLCGTETIVNGAKCGYQKVTDAAKCGYEQVKCGTEYYWQTVKNGAECGWKTVSCYLSFWEGWGNCKKPKECSVKRSRAKYCDEVKSCDDLRKPKSCQVAKRCEDLSKPKTCETHDLGRYIGDLSAIWAVEIGVEGWGGRLTGEYCMRDECHNVSADVKYYDPGPPPLVCFETLPINVLIEALNGDDDLLCIEV